ncbi:MAG: glycosyl hydrolase [Acidobacteriota bacterium]
MRISEASRFWIALSIGLALSLAVSSPSRGQAGVDSSVLKGMRWRQIGPYRGGRVTAVAGVRGQPAVYFMGSTGGGVWTTEDAGLSWRVLSDRDFSTASIGAVAVAESDPRVIYVGTGEACLRNDISHGDGVYKSTDGGKTWTNVGLRDSRHIARIRIHPRDPDVVYVAALGHPFGRNQERGVFRSEDGGKSWRRVLYVNDATGASDLIIDPTNPSILYAGMWQVEHTPWGIFSGGPGSGLYKSTDGGDSWRQLTHGLPAGDKGRIGVAVSPVNPSRVWALVEAEDGGVYRSDDGGGSWQLLNDGIQVRRRAYYYSHIFADTQEEETVYVLTSPLLKSTDGGKTFRPIRVPHGDNHDLWIAPEDDERMINGNDGGAFVTLNGGKSWSPANNQPTGQFYMVATDDQFPYRIYGSQQDNGTVSIPSRTSSRGIDQTDWYSVGGGESGYIAPVPGDANAVYAGSYWGLLTRYDRFRNQVQNIQPWPEIPGGRQASEWKYRFNWTFPIIISPHRPDILYAAANVVFRTTSGGRSWDVISPDLTRDDKSKQTQRLTEIYDTIVSLVESPLQEGLIWAGSDDGLVHLSRDGGRHWQEVTPAAMRPWSRVNIIEASPHLAAAAYLAIDRHKLDDYKPYIYKTADFGDGWELISDGIPSSTFVRTIREDPKRRGLLYAGTETGPYVSFDDGEHWQSLRLNLPVTPIADLTVKDDDLIAATHGRSFWILDDLTPLQQLTPEVLASKAHLFRPRAAYRLQPSRGRSTGPRGQNPANGVVVDYYLGDEPEEEVTLEFLDPRGDLIKRFSSSSARRSARPPASKGINRFVWDMRYAGAEGIEGGTYLFGGNLRGPKAVPGTYSVRLRVEEHSFLQPFQIKKDPRVSTAQQGFQAQFDLLIEIRDRLSDAHRAANEMLDIRRQLEGVKQEAGDLPTGEPIVAQIERLDDQLNSVLHQVVELRFRGIDDQMLLYPVQLNVKIAYLQGVVASADQPPTAQAVAAFRDLSAQLDAQLAQWKRIVDEELPKLNESSRRLRLPVVTVRY